MQCFKEKLKAICSRVISPSIVWDHKPDLCTHRLGSTLSLSRGLRIKFMYERIILGGTHEILDVVCVPDFGSSGVVV